MVRVYLKKVILIILILLKCELRAKSYMSPRKQQQVFRKHEPEVQHKSELYQQIQYPIFVQSRQASIG